MKNLSQESSLKCWSEGLQIKSENLKAKGYKSLKIGRHKLQIEFENRNSSRTSIELNRVSKSEVRSNQVWKSEVKTERV